jgi:hypothetical protein
MTSRQIELVQSSFRAVQPILDAAAAMFYDRLFELDPTLRRLFHTPPDRQARMLAQALTIVVSSLDRPAQIKDAVEALGRRHVGYGVRDERHPACDRFQLPLAPVRETRIIRTRTGTREQAFTACQTRRQNVIRKFCLSMLAAAFVLATAPWAAAQTTAPGEVMFHWGAIHLGPGQALVLNFELTDHFGGPLTLPVELQLEDKNGNVIYRGSLEVSDGHAVSFAVGPEFRTLRSAIPADIYAVIGPDFRLLAPCLKVILPPGPNAPVDRMTPTLEVMDLLTGRLLNFANNPRMIIGVLAQ